MVLMVPGRVGFGLFRVGLQGLFRKLCCCSVDLPVGCLQWQSHVTVDLSAEWLDTSCLVLGLP